MKPVVVVYGTREGHTRRIAERVADDFSARGVKADLIDARKLPENFSLENYSAAIVAASVHRQQHEGEIVDFVKRRLDELQRIPSIFLSVSLTQASVEDPAAPMARRAQASADVQRMIDRFLAETGWLPSKVKPVAGALMYSKYNFILRFIMKRIAASAGGSTDTSRDHIYTNWASLDQMAEEFLPAIATVQSSPVQAR
ncbi:MAG: flavodoxin domain-containing protein [Acidobacteriia bacterium]|nr:flavodoxin domain-containing protein [Terriglobia bacterium]